MKQYLIIIVCLALYFTGCQVEKAPDHMRDTEVGSDQGKNLIKQMNSDDMAGLQWMNPPKRLNVIDQSLQIVPHDSSDFFNDPATGKIVTSAPLLYREVTGDFVALAHVKPDFSDTWNASNLMIFKDSVTWAKLAFENSDATGPSVVTVVTNKTSDDSNGAIMHDRESLWLKLIRKDHLFAMHWSKDGEMYYMARLFTLPYHETIRVGIAVQCPAGKGANHEILYFSIEKKSVNDLRKGF